jgi:tellurium resistance protein TerZ
MINLTKGSSINLKKNDVNLEVIYIGVNWGKITAVKSSLFGLVKNEVQTNVDLDVSVAVFDANNRLLDTVFFNKTTSDDFAIQHSGDDRKGDDKADETDNETIYISLKKMRPNAEKLVIFINSYNGQEFDTIPYSKIRILDNTEGKVAVFAQFNLSSQAEYKGKRSMVMAKVLKEKDGWRFMTIGEPTETIKVNETIKVIEQKFL